MENKDHNHGTHPDGVELPIPTAWPMIAALGISLGGLGLLTNMSISYIGIIIGLIGAVGWFKEVFPVPKHDVVPFVPAAKRTSAVKASPRRVGHLRLGEGGHRERVPTATHRYVSGIYGGLAGGTAMAVLATLYGLVAQHSIWYPINLLAASAMPSMATASLEVLRDFNAGAFVVALLAHGALCIMIGLLYTVLLPMLPPKNEWFWGGIVTPLIWTAFIYPTFNLINPALAQRVDWLWFVICQVSFGIVGGFVVFKSGKVQTMQSWSIAERMGVHAMESPDKE